MTNKTGFQNEWRIVEAKSGNCWIEQKYISKSKWGKLTITWDRLYAYEKDSYTLEEARIVVLAYKKAAEDRQIKQVHYV